MEYTLEQYIEKLKEDKEILRKMINDLTTKTGNEEYRILRNKISVITMKIKYHTDQDFKNRRLEDYKKWYDVNKCKKATKTYSHSPIQVI